MARKITVTTPIGKEPPPLEVMADAIVAISDAAKRMSTTRVKRDTIIMLIAHSAKTSQRNVRAVLDAMEQLEREYLKPRTEVKK